MLFLTETNWDPPNENNSSGGASGSDLRITKAKVNEIQNLIRRESFLVVLKEEIPDGINYLTALLVLAIKALVRVKHDSKPDM